MTGPQRGGAEQELHMFQRGWRQWRYIVAVAGLAAGVAAVATGAAQSSNDQ